jgi:rhodanese-related sulfurtransferase
MNRTRHPQHTVKKQVRSSRNVALLIGLGILAVLVLAGILLMRRSPGGSPALAAEVSVEQALSMRESGAFVLDVRQPEEWLDHHIPGSTLIPLGELSARLSELPETQEILVVCRSGNRSAQGRDILLEAGFDQVTSMAGGLTDWRAAGYPTVSGP